MQKVMTKFKNIIRSIIVSVVTILTMGSCDPEFHIEVHLKNATSQTITFHAIRHDKSDSLSVDYYDYINKSYIRTLKSGEKCVLFEYEEMGWISSEDLEWFMEHFYPDGIVMKYENGDSIIYHPSGIDTDFHSPYNRNSFFCIDKTDEVLISEYDVLY